MDLFYVQVLAGMKSCAEMNDILKVNVSVT